MNRPFTRAALLATLLCLLTTSTGARAAGPLLLQSDAPPGFGTLHTKSYTTWVKKMKIVTRVKGMGKSTASCNEFAAFKADGWKTGTIQTFDSPGLLSAFDLCENVFSSVSGAQSAYGTATTDMTKHAAKVKGLDPITGAQVGDASQGVFGVQGSFVNAELIFRRGSVVVLMIYIGSSQFTGTAFMQTAQRASGRIS